ncbi:hypothetical protein [Clostridium frigidicarnis]|uniref:Methyltransferase domain-containing protein n=1 Tax=Clostridium frigidicarnis TaxID=84698 RepID=A0A1I1A1C6_9CLOT|nr:hypothetical protein [Clostridium frigidicarnis]SFB30430.1 hypothetical protein SAMN04488528_102716 [Clostridium frigidicarnis]
MRTKRINYFDMVINKHEVYNVYEVKRILKPNDIFVTHQVGGKNNESLSKRLIKNFSSQYSYINFNYVSDELKRNSFEILYKNEYFTYLRFYDIGALVYFAKIIQWEFPGFSVDTCFDELLKIHEEFQNNTYIESLEHRFIIACKNIKR